ncbi:MAG: trigger factor [Candidatus Peregrinibacteria bacterium]
MEYKIKNLPKSEVEISITVPQERMGEFEKKAADDISKDIKIKGFRPGHVPPHILEQYIDKKYLKAHTQEIAIQKAYAEVAIKEKLQVVSRPKVKIDSDEPLTFTATVAVMPEVTVKDYSSIKVPKEEAKVTEKDIEAVFEDLKKYARTYKDADRPAKKGDRVEVDFEGFDDKDAPIPNTKSKNHPVIIGEGSLIPGFEDELVGLKKDEKKEFNLTFPKDYGKKDFQNKKVKFKVEVKRIEEPQETEMNEEFVEKITGKKQSLEELKKDIEKNILSRKEREARQKRENKYLEELLKKTKVEIPDAMIDEEAEYIIQDMKDDISSKGMEFEKYLEHAKTNEDELRKKYRPEAEKRIKVRLALRHVITQGKFFPTEAEIRAEFDKMKTSYPPEEDKKLDKEFEAGGLKAQLANKLALEKLFEKVLG